MGRLATDGLAAASRTPGSVSRSFPRTSTADNENLCHPQARPLLTGSRDPSPANRQLRSGHLDATRGFKAHDCRSDQLHSPETSPAAASKWLPYTLRLQYMLIPALASLCIFIVTPNLVWYSQSHYGLGSDNGSSIALFGWRFTPTLIAVLYTQLTAILFEDVKRTEPFDRLARSTLTGATAATTILQTGRAWWLALADGFSKKKNGGRRSAALICSAAINIIAFLLISPLSASLLTTQMVSVSEQTDFVRMVPADGKNITLHAGRETYLRTTSNFLANISTTDWITDSYVVLPFWPSTQSPRLGQDVLDSPGSWQTDAMVFRADLSCTNMSLVSMTETRQRYSESLYNCSGQSFVDITYCDSDSQGDPVSTLDGYIPLISTAFASADGCQYGFELPFHFLYTYADSGGYVTWTNMSIIDDFNLGTVFTQWIVGNETRSLYGPANDFIHSNHSEACGDKEILLLTTPWLSGDSATVYEPNLTLPNNIRLQCLLCSQSYNMAKVPITLSKESGNIGVAMAEEDFLSRRTAVPETLMDHLDIQSLGLHQNWSTIVGASQNVQSGKELFTAGITSVLSTLFDNNLTNMIGNPELISQAARLRNRFFHELILSSVLVPGAFDSEAIRGEQVTVQKRVVVVPGVGITLTILFGISFLLYLILLYHTRPNRRPLGVEADPATTVNIAMLFDSRHCSSGRMQGLHRYSKGTLTQTLQMQQYYLQAGKLHEVENIYEMDKGMDVSKALMPSRWEPHVLRLRTLSALLALLVGLLAAILVLHQIAVDGNLHQATFVYQIDTYIFGDYWAAFSPFSFVPAIVAVLTGLWWGAMDHDLRSLEPYISMSRSPKNIASGAGLSYNSAYWLWASLKAAKKRSWGIASVTLGTTLSQILIVSLSALFEIQSGSSSMQYEMHRSSELRQIPIISNLMMTVTDGSSITYSPNVDQIAIQTMYVNDSGSWIYGATNQLTLNGTGPSWSLDEWSFLPLDLSGVPKTQSHPRSWETSSSDQNIQVPLINVTINTAAIRARLECNPIEQVAQKSSWVSKHNISHPSASLIASKGPPIAYQLRPVIFNNTAFNTSMLATPLIPNCCVNESSDTRRSALGYWSTTNATGYPHANAKWPVTFSSKWVLGSPRYSDELANITRYAFDLEASERDFGRSMYSDDQLLFTEEPMLQAVHCNPIIETAEADITVDASDGRVQHYRILNDPEPADSPWYDAFVYYTKRTAQICDDLLLCDEDGSGEVEFAYPNVTSSYGVLFIDALLGASFRAASADSLTPRLSDIEDHAYTFRDRSLGLNLDLMTYAMYVLAGRDPNALLNATTLANTTERVFQTFFQHFVSAGWAFQSINESLPSDLPPPVDRETRNVIPQREYPKLNTNRTAMATVTEAVDVLHISETATWLCVAILMWLIATTLVIIGMQLKHRHLMLRNVECMADVLVLIAGSYNFLRLVEERGMELGDDESVFTRLGWFRRGDGEVRYGIEVVGGEDAVEWVEAPEDWVAAQRKSTSKLREMLRRWGAFAFGKRI